MLRLADLREPLLPVSSGLFHGSLAWGPSYFRFSPGVQRPPLPVEGSIIAASWNSQKEARPPNDCVKELYLWTFPLRFISSFINDER